MITMKYTALVTILAIVVTFYFSARVGAGRVKLGIDAPAMTGNPTFAFPPIINAAPSSETSMTMHFRPL